jgi:putative transferase (TIGR04331 family)
MFRPQRPGLPGVFSTLLHRFFGLLEKVPNNKAKFQSLGFTMDRYYLAKYGMLGPFSFFQKRFNLDLESSLKNLKLRESLLGDLEVILKPQYERFLLQILGNLQKRKLKQLSLAYCCILVDWFPILFLEGLSLNLKKVSQKLCADNSVGTIGHSINSDLGYLVSAVTRLAGKTIFGIQHGGHNGYIDDNAAHGQTEYALYDKMITWGWTEIDDHLPHCETIPLPSPKLSEQSLKANYLKNVKSKSKDMRDILFLSNLFHRFPYASTCGQSRVDFIDEITNSQEDLMLAIKDAELTVCHKPYNMRFVDLYPEHYRRIEMAGGTGYQLLKSTHKGLKVKLIMTCRILLWDQIGTGTLECLTSEVPSMIYWKRIYSRESLWAKDLIARLEQNGIIHSSPETLTQEIKRYLGDPESWMNNSSRKQAIKDFCQKFALTDPRWFDKWKEFLSQSSMQ